MLLDATVQLAELAQPLLDAPAFVRLSGITFLGILSPHFDTRGSGSPPAPSAPNPVDTRGSGSPPAPSAPNPVESSSTPDDGTRADHSLGVAAIAVDLARRLGLSTTTQRYAAAWGLLHDIATWPLSHTSEPAFARLTGVSARELRQMMILGDSRIPSALQVNRALDDMGVHPRSLLALFRGPAPYASIELHLLAQVIRSHLTPDTLDGMWRTGHVYGVTVPAPEEILAVLGRNLFDVTVAPGGISLIGEFWERKGRIYGDHINTPQAMRRDSTWSLAIERTFADISLAASLELSEADVIRAVQRMGLPSIDSCDRYKPPHEYRFCASSARRMVGWTPISSLSSVLLKTTVPS